MKSSQSFDALTAYFAESFNTIAHRHDERQVYKHTALSEGRSLLGFTFTVSFSFRSLDHSSAVYEEAAHVLLSSQKMFPYAARTPVLQPVGTASGRLISPVERIFTLTGASSLTYLTLLSARLGAKTPLMNLVVPPHF